MRRILTLGLVFLACSCQRAAKDDGKRADTTYYKDVKPLLDEKCAGCHAEGKIGFPLTGLEEVKAKQSAVVDAVEKKRMPIWLAASGHQAYRDDPTFTPAEIETLTRWRDQGFAEGDPADTPKDAPGANLVDLAADVTIPLLAPGKSFTPNQKSADDYHCFPVEWPYSDKTKYMTGFQAVPGNPQVVHHLVAYMLDPSVIAMVKELDAEEPGVGYQCFGGALPDRLGDKAVYQRMAKKYPEAFAGRKWSGEWLGHWAPGMRGNVLPEGTGLPIRSGGMLVVQVHYYTLTAPNTADQGSEVRFKLADEVDKPGFILPLSKDDWLAPPEYRTLVVPPGGELTVDHAMPIADVVEDGKAITGVKDVASIEIHSSNLHMHSYGKSAVAYLTNDKTATKEVLLEIPAWNLNWQRDFTLAEPKVVPAAEFKNYSLELSCSYENKTNKEVFGGLGSGDEMCFDFTYVVLVK